MHMMDLAYKKRDDILGLDAVHGLICTISIALSKSVSSLCKVLYIKTKMYLKAKENMKNKSINLPLLLQYPQLDMLL